MCSNMRTAPTDDTMIMLNRSEFASTYRHNKGKNEAQFAICGARNRVGGGYSSTHQVHRDFRERAAVPALHVPILRCRIKAFGVVPSQPATTPTTLDRQSFPTDRRQLKTYDSRADEISSFQPLLLGSQDEIIMHVHGTSV